MKHFYKSIQGWFDFQDIYANQVKRVEDARFVEVGAWRGKSTAFMGVEIINSGKQITFDVIDTWQGADTPYQNQKVQEIDVYQEFLDNLDPCLQQGFMRVVRMSSAEAATLYEESSVDFVFIDASHEYEDVKRDIKVWTPKVKQGGVIGGHDYSRSHPGVKKAVGECFDEFDVIGNSWTVEV